MEKKICSKCLIEKEVIEFHKHKGCNDGYYTICKDCRKPISEKYVKENKEKIKKAKSKSYFENHQKNIERNREYIKKERKKRLDAAKKYYQENKEKRQKYIKEYYEKNKEITKQRSKEWRENNRERNNKTICERLKVRKKEDVLFKLKHKIRTDIYISLRRNLGKKRSKKIEEIIGLPINEYKKYIESQFEDWMSWDNWGQHTWHIDHIIPLSSAKNEEEMYRLWHYTNLRPLSAKENLKKSSKLIIL